MKPFDGGGWRGVSRIADAGALMQAYDSSGQSMMHLQAAIEDFEVFVRALGIGPQVQPMQYDPSQPQHARYQTNPNFLSPEKSREIVVLTKIINAFFRWELNSCEAIIKNGIVYPIDFANACPDMHLTSLHIYWPWAVKSLLAWSTFCLATGRRMRLDMNTHDYFEIANSEMPWEEKLAAYEALVDELLRHPTLRRISSDAAGLARRSYLGVRANVRLRHHSRRPRARQVSSARARSFHCPLSRVDAVVGRIERKAAGMSGRSVDQRSEVRGQRSEVRGESSSLEVIEVHSKWVRCTKFRPRSNQTILRPTTPWRSDVRPLIPPLTCRPLTSDL